MNLFPSSVKSGQKDPKASTQLHLKVAEIHDDTVVLKNGGVRAVLSTSSINLNLKSEEEQNAVIYSYQNFLNSLEFPVQIVIRSKKLDLDNYIEGLKKMAVNQANSLLQKQTFEYIDYISRLIDYADIMQKEFYVVVPQDPLGQEKRSFFSSIKEYIFPQDTVSKFKERQKQFENLKKKLDERVNTVRAGLESCNLKVERLDTEQLIALFYETYNPLTARSQKIVNSKDLALEHDEDQKIDPGTKKAA